MDHWHLERKLREELGRAGASEEAAFKAAELARAVLARSAPRKAAPPVSPGLAENIILENYHAEDFRRILGVNRFDGCLWFNKEAFEAALLYGPLFAALERPGAFTAAGSSRGVQARYKSASQWRKYLGEIDALVRVFKDAEARSEYQLAGLLPPPAQPEAVSTAGRV
jgi:hypothetical protein